MSPVPCRKAPFLMSQCCPDYAQYPVYPDKPINIRSGLCIPPYVALTRPCLGEWKYVATRSCTARAYDWGDVLTLYVNDDCIFQGASIPHMHLTTRAGDFSGTVTATESLAYLSLRTGLCIQITWWDGASAWFQIGGVVTAFTETTVTFSGGTGDVLPGLNREVGISFSTKGGRATDGSVVFTHDFGAGDVFTLAGSMANDYRFIDADLADAWLGIFATCGAAPSLNHPTDGLYQTCQDALYAEQMACETAFWDAMMNCWYLPEEELAACMAAAEATYNACLSEIDWTSCDNQVNNTTACLRAAGIMEYQDYWADLEGLVTERQNTRATGLTNGAMNVELALFFTLWGHIYPFGLIPWSGEIYSADFETATATWSGLAKISDQATCLHDWTQVGVTEVTSNTRILHFQKSVPYGTDVGLPIFRPYGIVHYAFYNCAAGVWDRMTLPGLYTERPFDWRLVSDWWYQGEHWLLYEKGVAFGTSVDMPSFAPNCG